LPGDTDQGDGQGQSNATRKLQASALLNFVSQVQTTSGDADVLVIGDLNAYNQEDPIDVLRAGGLIRPNTSTESYVFNGQTGSLDHALITPSLSSQLTGVEHWNINADEPNALDYNDNVLDAGESSFNPPYNNDTSLYAVNPFRSSDHDPVLVGLNLVAAIVPNQILGTSNRDVLIGTAADETIIGREGGDTLTGGGGNDTFVYNTMNDSGDRITDFTTGDKINLSNLLLSLNPSIVNPISEGYVQFAASGANTFVQIDQDGSAGNLFAPRSYILVVGVATGFLNNPANFIF